MLKRYLVLSVATAAFSLPSLVYAAQQNILSVHILNQQTGKPAADVTVTLEKKADNGWLQLNTAKTDKDGRIKALWPEQTATTGDYRVVFKTGDYFKKQNLESFFPEIPVEFHINKVNEHYHVPLLLREGANKQVISSQADSLIKISRIWADFFPANTSNQPI